MDSGRVTANGIDYYYEIHGEGEPLLVLHGGLGNINLFGPSPDLIAAGRQVIAVDLHGHGRTPLGDRPISLVDMGDDMAVLLTQLGYRAGRRDGLLDGRRRRLPPRRAAPPDGAPPRAGLDRLRQDALLPRDAAAAGAGERRRSPTQMKDTPMYEIYVAVAPHPEDFPRLLDRMGELMRKPYDFSEDVKTLRMPVMLVYGDSDMFRLEHVVEFYQLLGGGLRDAGWQRETMSQNRLAIIPDADALRHLRAAALVPTVLPFLNGETHGASGADEARRAA